MTEPIELAGSGNAMLLLLSGRMHALHDRPGTGMPSADLSDVVVPFTVSTLKVSADKRGKN